MDSDTIYCPCCDTPLVVYDDNDEEIVAMYGETHYASIACPLCDYERSAVEPTLCECWAIIEADMERARRIR